MAITTAGGSGSGTGSLALTTAANVALFTTPNTANAIFIVTVTATIPLAPYTTAVAQNPHEFSFRTIVGPNAAVALPLYNAYTGGPVNYAYSYQWCSIVFS